MIHQRHRQTDDMQSQDRALHYSASRSKKNIIVRTRRLNSFLDHLKICGKKIDIKVKYGSPGHWFYQHYNINMISLNMK